MYYKVFKLIEEDYPCLKTKFPICSVVSKAGILITPVKGSQNDRAHLHSGCSSSSSVTGAVCPCWDLLGKPEVTELTWKYLVVLCFVFAPSTGVSSLSIQFAKLPKGLKHLNLSKTSLSPKGMFYKYASFSLIKLSDLHTKKYFFLRDYRIINCVNYLHLFSQQRSCFFCTPGLLNPRLGSEYPSALW